MKDFLSEAKRQEVLAALQILGCQDEAGREQELQEGELDNYRCCNRSHQVYY